jgi:hypothetical protein
MEYKSTHCIECGTEVILQEYVKADNICCTIACLEKHNMEKL